MVGGKEMKIRFVNNMFILLSVEYSRNEFLIDNFLNKIYNSRLRRTLIVTILNISIHIPLGKTKERR